MRNKTLLAAAAARLIPPALCVAQGTQDSAPAPQVAKDRRSPASRNASVAPGVAAARWL